MESFREEQTAIPLSDRGEARSAESALVAFRARARHLLQQQRQRVFHVETQLMARMQSLLDELHDARAANARLSRECRELREGISHGRSGTEAVEESADLEELRRHLVRLRAERDELRELVRAGSEDADRPGSREWAELQQRLEMAVREIRDLADENSELKERAREAEASERDPRAADELQQRLEAAERELRGLRDENSQLERRLAAGPRAVSAGLPEQGFDWETQKKRLLQQLESDFDVDDPAQKRDRLTVEGAIRITDQVVAEKDEELAELRRLLENQSSNLGSVAVGAAALEEVLDRDELVREQKAQLEMLQEEWREKLRRAEVEISVERAKMARERMELEEKLRALHSSQSEHPSNSADAPPLDKNRNRPRGRWLTRLGLQEDEK